MIGKVYRRMGSCCARADRGDIWGSLDMGDAQTGPSMLRLLSTTCSSMGLTPFRSWKGQMSGEGIHLITQKG